ncbi:MAG: glutaminase domain-containing protein, partial [Chitinophagaceae bacterium]
VRIDWGHLYLAVPDKGKMFSLVASSENSVTHFAETGNLDLKDDPDVPRAAENSPVTLAAAYDLGNVSSETISRHIILAYDQIDCIEYFHQTLKPWWARKGMNVDQMLTIAERDYPSVLQKCDQFDYKLYRQTLAAGGEKYAKMCELAYRQSFAACKLAAGPKGNPLLFTKECFSNGDISTVDVIFPTCPISLVYNPVLLKALLDPLFYYCESGRWTKPYSPHDLGTFPIANGRKNEETMPIEETGNMLIMAAAIARAEGNASYAKEHWKVLSTWADYLLKFGMDPGDQLCTDDFAGPSAHNANLSIKAILGIASYGRLADMLGEKSLAKEYTDTARQMAKQWITMDENGNHFKLEFDKPGTWSQKYNLVWDKVLQLHIFPKSVAQKAIAYYLTKQNKYGLPLDSRKTYTKADWIMWTATLADNDKDFRALIAPEYKYICETPSRVPISDWYETTNAKQVGFQARSVVGGFFMKTLDKKWNGH